MASQLSDHFGILDTFTFKSEQASFYRLRLLESLFGITLKSLPYSLRILLEAAVRKYDGQNITEKDVEHIARWSPDAENAAIPFMPARIIMQDHSGIPCLLDLAALREALNKAGKNPKEINPLLAVDLIIDHSVQVDFSASPSAFQHNAELEFQRNRERYEFLRWATEAFHNLRVVPPNTGIIHQVNLEYLARVVMQQRSEDTLLLYPDTLVGTDSHTTMINALGIVGWGVGGIEAEAIMMGQHISLPAPQVIGVEIIGHLQEGVTATDLALAITQRLRQKGVVEKFVEFYGTGLKQLSLPDRATIANMAPEYGATMGYFPIDAETIRYLQDTGRTDTALLAEWYYQEQDLLYTDSTEVPRYTENIQFDLSAVVPAIAGPKRPQDRINLADVKKHFTAALTAPTHQQGYGIAPDTLSSEGIHKADKAGSPLNLEHGSIVLAAITSCTNTSNPSVMIGAGLLARNALQRGLSIKPSIKTSMAPGSQVVGRYLAAAGLLEPLNTLGFHIVGYGCTVCIGNSGALHADVAQALTENPLVVAAVLSGNRNFEGRIHPQVKANFLASPPLVIAYALAGTININLLADPLGYDQSDHPIYLRDIWPTRQEISEIITQVIKPEMFLQSYKHIWEGSAMWNSLSTQQSNLYQWSTASTYIQEPPFFQNIPLQLPDADDITNARVLLYGGDSVTTDHISPAGNIAYDSPAGKYLRTHGVARQDFNQYGTRRGNDQVMLRGTFANVRLKNLLTPDVEGGFTLHLPTQECLTVFDAAERYQKEHIPLIILAGKDYGMGSSRDWAAKGTKLLGVKAVIAESYERIHRSNLIGMGVLPLQFKEGQNARLLALSGHETFTITGLSSLQPGKELSVLARKEDGTVTRFPVIAQLHTPLEKDYYIHGGIFPKLLRQHLTETGKSTH